MTPIPTVRVRSIARPSDRVRPSDSGIPLSLATAGDHMAVHHFLRYVLQAPSSHEFQAQLDEPSYEPRDRLLVKHRDHIVSHLRLIRREMRFGACHLPITSVTDVATAPEFCRRGYASALLASAAERMREEGSVLGLLRTRQIDFYRRRGWTVCGRHSYSAAAPHGILSRLSRREPALRQPTRKKGAKARRLHIRYWRRVEQDALTRLYAGDSSHGYGAFLRTDPGWNWVISRQAYDQIYVAVEGPPRLEPRGSSSRIVGYAVVKKGRIVELVVSPRRPDAAEQLLSRVSSDAVELDVHELRLDGPPNDPLHATMRSSGGGYHGCTVDNGYAHMVQVVDFSRLSSLLHSEFLARAAASGLDLPVELGFSVNGRRYALQIAPTHSRLSAEQPTRDYLRCSRNQLVQMLLGQVDVETAVARGDVVASTPRAAEHAGALLPRLPLWYPAFDDLPA